MCMYTTHVGNPLMYENGNMKRCVVGEPFMLGRWMCLDWRTNSDTNVGYNFGRAASQRPTASGRLAGCLRLLNPSLSATNSSQPQRAAIQRPAGHATLVCAKSLFIWSQSNTRGHAGLPKIQCSCSAAENTSRPTQRAYNTRTTSS